MKKSTTITIAIFLLLFLLIFIFIILPKKKTDKDIIPEQFTIYYTYGGGFGTKGETIIKEVEINSNGHITMRINKEENVKPLEYDIKEEKVKELYEYLIENGFEKLKEDQSDNTVMDGSTDYIEIKSNKVNKKVGGYASFTNEKFNKMLRKTRETISNEKMIEFDEKVRKIIDK